MFPSASHAAATPSKPPTPASSTLSMVTSATRRARPAPGRPQRQISLASRPARTGQVGDVDASDEERDRDRAEQQPQWPSDVAAMASESGVTTGYGSIGALAKSASVMFFNSARAASTETSGRSRRKTALLSSPHEVRSARGHAKGGNTPGYC